MSRKIASKIILPGLPGRPIPNSTVDLLLSVNAGRCRPPSDIGRLDKTWMRVSLPQIVTSGAIHFHGSPIQKILTENQYQARKRKVWEVLSDYAPQAILVNGQNRLVFRRGSNSDEQSRLSFIVGDAVGIEVAKRAYGVSLAAITRCNFNTKTRHDYELVRGTKKVLLETRGRFNHGGAARAIAQIADKFGHRRGFSQACGLVVYPSDKITRSFPDVEITDPEYEAAPLRPIALVRQILVHYAPLFVCQNVPAANAIARLLHYDNAALEHMLTTNGNELFHPGDIRPQFWGRVTTMVGGKRFIGTFYDRWPPVIWPHPTPPDTKAPKGTLFWGISEDVVRVLGTYASLNLLNLRTPDTFATHDYQMQYVLHDDGVVVVWAPDLETMLAKTALTKS